MSNTLLPGKGTLSAFSASRHAGLFLPVFERIKSGAQPANAQAGRDSKVIGQLKMMAASIRLLFEKATRRLADGLNKVSPVSDDALRASLRQWPVLQPFVAPARYDIAAQQRELLSDLYASLSHEERTAVQALLDGAHTSGNGTTARQRHVEVNDHAAIISRLLAHVDLENVFAWLDDPGDQPQRNDNDTALLDTGRMVALRLAQTKFGREMLTGLVQLNPLEVVNGQAMREHSLHAIHFMSEAFAQLNQLHQVQGLPVVRQMLKEHREHMRSDTSYQRSVQSDRCSQSAFCLAVLDELANRERFMRGDIGWRAHCLRNGLAHPGDRLLATRRLKKFNVWVSRASRWMLFNGFHKTPLRGFRELPGHEAKSQKQGKDRVLEKIDHLLGALKRGDNIALSGENQLGISTLGLGADLLGGVVRAGPQIGVAGNRGARFELLFNEEFLQIFIGASKGSELQAGASVGAGSPFIGPYAGLRIDPVVTRKDRLAGVMLRIPCPLNALDPVEDKRRREKAIDTAKQVIERLSIKPEKTAADAQSNAVWSDLFTLCPQLEVCRLEKGSISRRSARASLDFSIKVLKAGTVSVGAGFQASWERIFSRRQQIRDQALKGDRELRGTSVKFGLRAGLMTSPHETVLMPMSPAVVTGIDASDEGAQSLMRFQGRMSRYSYRQIEFASRQTLEAVINALKADKRLTLAHARQAMNMLNDVERKERKAIEKGSSSGSDSGYALRVRIDPEVAAYIDALEARELLCRSQRDSLRKNRSAIDSQNYGLKPALMVKQQEILRAEQDAWSSRLRQVQSERDHVLQAPPSWTAPQTRHHARRVDAPKYGIPMVLNVSHKAECLRLEAAKVLS